MTMVTERQTNPWLLAIRLKTLPAAVAPIITATALVSYHDHAINGWLTLLCLLCALFLQIMVNIANDLFDAENGIDNDQRLGPTRVTQSGLITPQRMRVGLWVTGALSLLTGLPLIMVGGWPLAIAGAASLLAALAYSAGPWPLASHALGEVTVLIFFGIVAVVGCYWVQVGQWHIDSLWLALMVGLPSCAILLVNNIRDIETDRAAHKHTLPACVGKTVAGLIYLGALLAPFAIALGMALAGHFPIGLPIILAPTVFWAWFLYRQVMTLSGRPMNNLLAHTARFELAVSLLVAIILVVN